MNRIFTLLLLFASSWPLGGHVPEKTGADKIKLTEALERISETYNVYFTYDRELTGQYVVNYIEDDYFSAEHAIQRVLEGTNLTYQIFDSQFVIVYLNNRSGLKSVKQMINHLQDFVEEKEKDAENESRQNKVVSKLVSNQHSTRPIQKSTFNISGRITDTNNDPLIGVNIMVKGTNKGTATDLDGSFVLTDIDENDVLVISYIGFQSVEVGVNGTTYLQISLEADAQLLDELVVVGYGTMRKSDLTGSVVRADINSFRNSPNISIAQSLQGSVPGLSVGQVTRAGQDPGLLIRGQSSLSGETAPLIVVDNVIFRGNLVDLNPNDIESVDILKDASSTAIYGSQAANGVILITTSKSGGSNGKPLFNYTGSYSFQSPGKDLRPGNAADYLEKVGESDIFFSRTEESGYRTKNPDYNPVDRFKSIEEIRAFNDNRTTDWYDLLTNDNMRHQSHNLSMSNSTDNQNYLISLGYTSQQGYLLNDQYSRINARINFDNSITSWLRMGVQSFLARSDYPGEEIPPVRRYLTPFATSHDENGRLIDILTGNANTINPLIIKNVDFQNKRLNLIGNAYADVSIPFVEGLSYRLNFGSNYRTINEYYFRPYSDNWQGQALKQNDFYYDMTLDHIVSYQRQWNRDHHINATLLYGLEKRNFNYTGAMSSSFITHILGYHRLQDGNANQQTASSGAWEESSLYNMARLFYGYKGKYLITGTIRRDGFSGFSEENKFGVFPSLAAAWVISEENFISADPWLDNLKIRMSYGANGNRTIARYQTLARVSGGFNYVTGAGNSIYTQSISSLASPNLKWETSTGINLGIDFGVVRRIYGSIDYYNNHTTDLLYEVDIPGISRFEKFPDNLGKLHNQGLELTINSINIDDRNFEWRTSFNFSRSRDKLVELLGFDLDNDGNEDDLISEGLFIGHSIHSIYDYRIDGKWQVNDEIPNGFDIGSNRVVDLNGDGVIDQNDKEIIGTRSPSYLFGIQNSLEYKNWNLTFFINSIQGGKNNYLSEDDLSGFLIMNGEGHFLLNFPLGLDYWTPENPDARYQRPNTFVTPGIAGQRYSQRNFIRLQDISLSYDLSSGLLRNVGLYRSRIFLNGKNLITLTKWQGWDPETGESITRNGLPVMRSFSFGLNIEF